MLKIKQTTGIIASFILGIIFIYSGYTKLLPIIETFEFTFVEMGIASWYTAPVLARVMIGLEFFLGILLIINYNLRKFTLLLTGAMLLLFIIYLAVQIWLNGDNGNCGCFGEHLYMTPLQAIYKNIMMLAGCVLVYFTQEGWKTKYHPLLTSSLLLTMIIVPFVVNPVDYSYTSNNLNEKVNYRLELDLLYEPEDTAKVEIPGVELRKGKHVVAFLSLTCQHCRIAAKKLMLIRKNNPEIPVYFVLNGDKEKLEEFMEETRAYNIPFSFCLGKTFVQLSSAQLPRIYYLDNSIVVKKVDYFELSQKRIEQWLETGSAE